MTKAQPTFGTDDFSFTTRPDFGAGDVAGIEADSSGSAQTTGHLGSKPAESRPSKNAETANVSASLSEIGRVARSLGQCLTRSVHDIHEINRQTTILSINAQIEAARAGASGRAFNIVAGEMVTLSDETRALVERMGDQSSADMGRLNAEITRLATDVRGVRLSDLALTNIDLIDRNLYERSCDVRWWATDAAAVHTLENPTPENTALTSARLGVILDSYTVYYDIVLCQMNGAVVANGRPKLYHSAGSNQCGAEWFRSALATTDGSQFGFQNLHSNPALAGGKLILVYSCAVREGGEARGKPIGVLGIVFNWEALAQTIVNRTLISPDEKPFTRVCIAAPDGLVLADTAGRLLKERLSLPDAAVQLRGRKGFVMASTADADCLIAHAASPGYETYATGWDSWIIQTMPKSGGGKAR